MRPRPESAGQLASPPPRPSPPVAPLVPVVAASPSAPRTGADAKAGRDAWQLVERVGQGTTAVVWRARHVDTGLQAALKEGQAGTHRKVVLKHAPKEGGEASTIH